MTAARQEVQQRIVIDGVPYIIRLIDNPMIDDVMASEAKLRAAKIQGFSVPSDHRVKRDLRDFLVRLGVVR